MKKLLLLILLTTHLFANYGANMQMMTVYAMTADNNNHKSTITKCRELSIQEQEQIFNNLAIVFSLLISIFILFYVYKFFTKPVPKYINGQLNPKWFSRNSFGSSFRS